MNELIPTIFVALAILAPMAAFVRAARQPNATVGSVVLASMLAGTGVGVCYFAVAGVMFGPGSILLQPAIYPWLFIFALWGALIGAAGVFARFVGRLWSTRL